MRKTAVVIAVAVACGVAGTGEAAQAIVLCRSKTSNVVTSRSTACKRGEARVDVTQLIGDGAIAGAKLADGGVTAGKLADGAITEGKLAAGVAPKLMSLNVYGAFLEGASFSAGFGRFAGIVLPDNSISSLAIGFTLPPNYTPGTPLSVRVLWHTSAMPCTVQFQPSFMSVARAGRVHLMGAFADSGLSVVGGTPVPAPVSGQTNETFLTIVSPEPGTSLFPGDAVNFGIFRRGDDPMGDTCLAPMMIQGLSVEYQ